MGHSPAESHQLQFLPSVLLRPTFNSSVFPLLSTMFSNFRVIISKFFIKFIWLYLILKYFFFLNHTTQYNFIYLFTELWGLKNNSVRCYSLWFDLLLTYKVTLLIKLILTFYQLLSKRVMLVFVSYLNTIYQNKI